MLLACEVEISRRTQRGCVGSGTRPPAFTRALATNLIDKGIRVNAIAPGPAWTPLNPADRPAEKVASFGSDTPMKRAAQPEEIAPAYVFMAAPACASYITGEILPIIGGYSGG